MQDYSLHVAQKAPKDHRYEFYFKQVESAAA